MAKNKMGLKTKAVILDAARTVFRQQGYDQCKVEEIAAQARVTKAMIYYHFESKEDIMLQLIKRLLTSIQQALPAASSNQPEEMQAHLHQMIKIWEDNQEITSFLVSRAFKDPIMFQSLQKIAAPFYDALLQSTPDPKEPKQNKNQHLDLFFFNTLPMLFFPLLRNQFAEQYHMSVTEVEQQFIERFLQVLAQNTQR